MMGLSASLKARATAAAAGTAKAFSGLPEGKPGWNSRWISMVSRDILVGSGLVHSSIAITSLKTDDTTGARKGLNSVRIKSRIIDQH